MTGSDNVLAARSLLEVCAHLSGKASLLRPLAVDLDTQPVFPDLGEVRGQSQAKRALEIAAAGNHSLLMVGPPGSGKSMLSRTIGACSVASVSPVVVLRSPTTAAISPA